MCRVQHLKFGGRALSVQIAARPEFVAGRRSTMPSFVLAFAIGMVVIVVSLLALMALVQFTREQPELRRRIMQEQHKMSLVEASKAAHEKTIAYACHQLRYVADTRELCWRYTWVLRTVVQVVPPMHSRCR